MFDESVNAEALQKILDEDFDRQQRQRDEAPPQQLGDIEATRQARRKAIAQEEQGTLDQLNQKKDARHVGRYAPPGKVAPNSQGAIGVTHDNVEGGQTCRLCGCRVVWVSCMTFLTPCWSRDWLALATRAPD